LSATESSIELAQQAGSSGSDRSATRRWRSAPSSHSGGRGLISSTASAAPRLERTGDVAGGRARPESRRAAARLMPSARRAARRRAPRVERGGSSAQRPSSPWSSRAAACVPPRRRSPRWPRGRSRRFFSRPHSAERPRIRPELEAVAGRPGSHARRSARPPDSSALRRVAPPRTRAPGAPRIAPRREPPALLRRAPRTRKIGSHPLAGRHARGRPPADAGPPRLQPSLGPRPRTKLAVKVIRYSWGRLARAGRGAMPAKRHTSRLAVRGNRRARAARMPGAASTVTPPRSPVSPGRFDRPRARAVAPRMRAASPPVRQGRRVSPAPSTHALPAKQREPARSSRRARASAPIGHGRGFSGRRQQGPSVRARHRGPSRIRPSPSCPPRRPAARASLSASLAAANNTRIIKAHERIAGPAVAEPAVQPRGRP